MAAILQASAALAVGNQRGHPGRGPGRRSGGAAAAGTLHGRRAPCSSLPRRLCRCFDKRATSKIPTFSSGRAPPASRAPWCSWRRSRIWTRAWPVNSPSKRWKPPSRPISCSGPETLRSRCGGRGPAGSHRRRQPYHRRLHRGKPARRRQTLALTMETLETNRPGNRDRVPPQKESADQGRTGTRSAPRRRSHEALYEAQARSISSRRNNLQAFLDVSRLETEYKGLVEKEKVRRKAPSTYPTWTGISPTELEKTPQGHKLIGTEELW